MSDVGEKIEAALVQEMAGALVTKWIVLAETIDPNTGDVQMEMYRSERTALWDSIGFARYYLAFCEKRIEPPPPEDRE